MSRASKIMMIVASLILIAVYFVPIWNISLIAPQYPEGLGLRIWINNVSGEKPHDLNNINNLNHYIGMKKIIPESIPELKIMPYVIGFMILLGLAAALLGRRKLLYLWVALFIIVGVVGMVDFYLWEYDYGHNLDLENASIKIPGMSYQPPLIGSKQLLNFTAVSLPGIGGYIIGVSVVLGLIASFREFKSSRKSNTGIIENEKAVSKNNSHSYMSYSASRV